jgi:hypothetical protein
MQQMEAETTPTAPDTSSQTQSLPAIMPLQYFPTHAPSSMSVFHQSSQQSQPQPNMMSTNNAISAYRQPEEQHFDARLNVAAMGRASTSDSAGNEPDFFAAMQASMSRPYVGPAPSRLDDVNRTLSRDLSSPYDMMMSSSAQQQQGQLHPESFDISQAWHGGTAQMRIPSGVEAPHLPSTHSLQSDQQRARTEDDPTRNTVSAKTSMAFATQPCPNQDAHADSMSQLRSFLVSDQFPMQDSSFGSLSGHAIRRSAASSSVSGSNIDQSDALKPSYPAFYNNTQQ